MKGISKYDLYVGSTEINIFGGRVYDLVRDNSDYDIYFTYNDEGEIIKFSAEFIEVYFKLLDKFKFGR